MLLQRVGMTGRETGAGSPKSLTRTDQETERLLFLLLVLFFDVVDFLLLLVTLAFSFDNCYSCCRFSVFFFQ